MEKGYPYLPIKINNQEIQLPLSYKIKKQKRVKRRFKKIKLELEKQIGGVNDTILYYPLELKFKNGFLFVLDQGDHSIKVFNESGRYIRKYGKKGKGPGEFLLPLHFDISQNSDIIVTDAKLPRITIFSKKNTKVIKMNYIPMDVSFLSNKSFAVLQISNLVKYPIIQVYDTSGNKILNYKNIIQNKESKNIPPMIITLNGNLLSPDNNNLLYIPRYMNHIISYSKDGSFNYSVETVDNLQIPIYKLSSGPNGSIGGSMRYLMENISSISSQIFRGNLLIISMPGLKKYHDKIFDIYNIKTGSYMYSYKINKLGSFTNIYLSNNRLYFIGKDTSIYIYKLNL